MGITTDPIDLSALLTETDPASGATVFFAGTVRNHHRGRTVRKLYYECYPTLAERCLNDIVKRVSERCGAVVLAVHRVGWMEIGDVAVAVVARSAHRSEAFDACRQAIDEIKINVPIWKREYYADGTNVWASEAESRESSSPADIAAGSDPIRRWL